MKTNIVELTLLTQEASELANKATLTKAEERKLQFLTGTAIPAVKAGATLQEVQLEELNKVERRNGLRLTRLDNGTSLEVRAKSLFLKKMFSGVEDSREIRTGEAEGSILSQIGTYTGLGNFVPTGFSRQTFATMAQHDALFDDDACTVIHSTDAKPYPIPVFDDLSNEAVQVNEAQTQALGSQVNVGNPGHVVLGAYSYITPVHYFSLEVYQDAGDGAGAGAYDLFAKFAGDRMARGIGAKMVTGNGSGTTLGLIPALQAAGVNGVVAAGSSGNTGGAETGTTSIGSADIAALYFSVNAAYRQSPKCAFMCADSTLAYLAKIVTKQGIPLVNFEDGVARIMGKVVRVSPSVPALGSSNICMLFGDMSYWNTRLVGGYVQTFKETRAEQGLVGLQYVMRADGVLAFNSPNVATTPISFLQNHS
jgi:HK97 family phage major capsid protein